MLLLFLLALSDPVNGDLLLELIDKHSNRLKSYVYGKTHNHEDEGEIVQDVFFKVYEKTNNRNIACNTYGVVFCFTKK